MKKFIFSCSIFLASAGVVLAANPFDITFPIPELGNCESQQACKIYCDDPGHTEACLSFAEAHGFTKKEAAAHARKLTEKPGPGGCRGEECKTYCADESHFNECISFAEREGFMSKEEAARARRFHNQAGPGGCKGEKCRTYCEDLDHFEDCAKFAEEQGFVNNDNNDHYDTDDNGLESSPRKDSKDFEGKTGPGGCKDEKTCRQYCEAPGHLDECLEFGVREGFMTKEEAARIRQQMKRGGKSFDQPGPGGCQGEACRTYCEDPEHQEECLRFAEEHNLMSAEELARAKKGLEISKKGGPGGCRGEKACHVYCANPDHGDECIAFAVENGFMPKEEAERAKKFHKASQEGGPGGCKGEECRDFCQKPENQKTCFEFGKKHNLISQEEERHFAAGQKLQQQVQEHGGPGGCRDDSACRAYCSDSAHSEECITFASIKGGVTPEEAKRMLEEFRNSGGQRDMHASKEGFSNFPRQEGGFGGPPPVFPEGPGGCKRPEECIKYCSEPAHREECAKFGPKAGGPPPGGTFRQGQPGSEGNVRPQDFPNFQGPTYEADYDLKCDPGWHVAKDNSGRIYCAIERCLEHQALRSDRFGRLVCVREDFLPQGSFVPRPQEGSGQQYPPRPSYDPPKYPIPSGSFAPRPYPEKYPPYQPPPGTEFQNKTYPTPYPGTEPPPTGGMYPPPTGAYPPPNQYSSPMPGTVYPEPRLYPIYPEGQTTQPTYPHEGEVSPPPPSTEGEYYKGNVLQAVLQYFWRVFLHPPL